MNSSNPEVPPKGIPGIDSTYLIENKDVIALPKR
jgi:hypothetical protein